MSQDSISEIAKGFNPEEHRAEWLKRLVDEFEKLEPLNQEILAQLQFVSVHEASHKYF